MILSHVKLTCCEMDKATQPNDIETYKIIAFEAYPFLIIFFYQVHDM